MILETFMEASRILYPHLQVRGVRQVRLKEMISVPPGVERNARIDCRRCHNETPEVCCEAALSIQDISPFGRLTDRFTEPCTGLVILDGGGEDLWGGLSGFPVREEELREGSLDRGKVLAWYEERSCLTGRYRVLESLDGAGPGVVRGRTIYRQGVDFAGMSGARLQYSPYLFEALLQLVGFQIASTNPGEARSIIPVAIGEMRFSRLCLEGEVITLEARLGVEDCGGQVWDARGLDSLGRAIMQVSNMRMNWVSA
jgi:hypothetical protein